MKNSFLFFQAQLKCYTSHLPPEAQLAPPALCAPWGVPRAHETSGVEGQKLSNASLPTAGLSCEGHWTLCVYVNRCSKLQSTILNIIFIWLGLVSYLYLFLNCELFDGKDALFFLSAASTPYTMLGTKVGTWQMCWAGGLPTAWPGRLALAPESSTTVSCACAEAPAGSYLFL